MPSAGDLRGFLAGTEHFSASVRRFGQQQPTRLFSTTPAKLAALVAKAERLDPDYRDEPISIKTFSQFVEIPCRSFTEAHKVAEFWRSTKGVVDSAYVSSIPSEPAVTTNDPECSYQGHCDPAPVGIDARYAWTVPGADGSTVNFIDIERGWNLQHEDLIDHGASLIGGTNLTNIDPRRHGTRVLGVVCARDNGIGCLGIAPNPRTVRVISRAGITGDAPSPTSNAIILAVQSLNFGDVLLLETQETHVDAFGRQTHGYTSEVLDDVFVAIRLASALGIIVIEAAGNGGHDLDTPAADPWQNRPVLAPGSGSYRDSGAIVVAGCQSNAPGDTLRAAWLGTNFGRRVNCFAWANSVHTCDNDPLSGDRYTPRSPIGRFSGTSAAAAIIAGAAIVIQSKADDLGKGRLSPKQMRRLLSDPDYSTSSLPRPDGSSPLIGRMPDLKAILDVGLPWVPDVYIRDFVGDTGVPHEGPVSLSPDIIVTPTPPADPDAAYGEGSGREDAEDLAGDLIAGSDQTIFVRARNRGAVAAHDVVATVYHAEPSTLPMPDTWTRIGRTTIPHIPANDVLAVSLPLAWPAVNQPGPGHYCFVATIHAADDPRPPLPAVFGAAAAGDVSLFLRYIRENNNVTWRNFNIAQLAPTATIPDVGEVLALPFVVPGLPEIGTGMQLDFPGELPESARLFLVTPGSWLPQLEHAVEFTSAPDGRLVVPIRPRLATPLPLQLEPDSRHPLCLLIDPRSIAFGEKRSLRIAARQLWNGRELGRMTWDLRPPA